LVTWFSPATVADAASSLQNCLYPVDT